jgi:hypothetical protein|eukprot:SAG25_NODE_761_length_5514_cov_23.676822_2_plen_161_part_00
MHPCASVSGLEAQLLDGVSASLRDTQALLRTEHALPTPESDGGGPAGSYSYCELRSRNEGFFSNVLAAVDGLLACAGRGLPSRIEWGGSDFPYRASGATTVSSDNSSAWELFFKPVGLATAEVARLRAAGARASVRYSYSRAPPQVPTQFERYACTTSAS